MCVYSASSCEEIVSLPILRAWISTWRYRESRAATPSDSRSPSIGAPSATAPAASDALPSALMGAEYPSCAIESEGNPKRAGSQTSSRRSSPSTSTTGIRSRNAA